MILNPLDFLLLGIKSSINYGKWVILNPLDFLLLGIKLLTQNSKKKGKILVKVLGKPSFVSFALTDILLKQSST